MKNVTTFEMAACLVDFAGDKLGCAGLVFKHARRYRWVDCSRNKFFTKMNIDNLSCWKTKWVFAAWQPVKK